MNDEREPNFTATFESREGPTPFRYHYAVEPDGDGSRLTLDADISSAGLPGPLAHLDAVATRAFKQGMQHNLDGLKHLVEFECPLALTCASARKTAMSLSGHHKPGERMMTELIDTGAPVVSRTEIEIAAPPEVVWDVVIPSWTEHLAVDGLRV